MLDESASILVTSVCRFASRNLHRGCMQRGGWSVVERDWNYVAAIGSIRRRRVDGCGDILGAPGDGGVFPMARSVGLDRHGCGRPVDN